MKQLIAPCLLLFLAVFMIPATAQAAEWTVEKENTRIGFAVDFGGNTLDVTFSEYDLTIVFDASDLEAASVELVIDTTSAAAGLGDVDRAITAPKWFSSELFPSARFTSSVFRALDDGSFEMDGTLLVRDVSREITIPFTLETDDTSATAKGELKMLRVDYDLGTEDDAQGPTAVGLDVLFSFDISANK